MRRFLIAGNWKMNLDRQAAVGLARAVVRGATSIQAVDLAVCPPFCYLEAVGGELHDSAVALGAQNMFHQPQGAFTGEISPLMLRDLGCRFVILGHSERRHVLGESDELINKKVHAASATGLTPIVCLGELLSEREAGKTLEAVRQQFAKSLAGLSAEDMCKTVLAYEPVWAIGTGKVASPDQAEEVHLALRKIIAERYNAQVAEAVRILYGGSVTPENAGKLLQQPDIDGALVGGASLKAEQFLSIAAAAR